MLTLNDFDIVKISDSKLMDISGGAEWTRTMGNITDHMDDHGCTAFFDTPGGHDHCDDLDKCTP